MVVVEKFDSLPPPTAGGGVVVVGVVALVAGGVVVVVVSFVPIIVGIGIIVKVVRKPVVLISIAPTETLPVNDS